MNKLYTCLNILGMILILHTPCLLEAQTHDYASADQVIGDLYRVISGPAGQREWDKMRELFHPAAVMGALRKSQDGQMQYMHFTLDEYIERNGPYFQSNGFFETEADRSTQAYGELMHVFSAYESRHTADGPVFMRGINSIQLIFEKGRWWIISIQWNAERADLPLPRSLN